MRRKERKPKPHLKINRPPHPKLGNVFVHLNTLKHLSALNPLEVHIRYRAKHLSASNPLEVRTPQFRAIYNRST